MPLRTPSRHGLTRRTPGRPGPEVADRRAMDRTSSLSRIRSLRPQERLFDPDDFARAEAPWKLAKLGLTASERTTERLVVQAFVDRDFDARWSALFATGRIAKRSPDVTRSILSILSGDPDPDVRQAAASALGGLWREAPSESVTGLAAALSDKDALVREDAAEVLGQIGIVAMDAHDALKVAFADPHSGVRARASQALRALGPPGSNR